MGYSNGGCLFDLMLCASGRANLLKKSLVPILPVHFRSKFDNSEPNNIYLCASLNVKYSNYSPRPSLVGEDQMPTTPLKPLIPESGPGTLLPAQCGVQELISSW
jgi:hypothetical protein